MTSDPVRSDVLVIGGGIVGITAALTAAEGGADVVVVDAGRHAGSSANAGSLHVQMQSRFLRLFPDQAPNVEASLPLYIQAVRLWEQLDERHGGFELSREGGLMVAETEIQLRFLEDKAARERRNGLSVDILDRAALGRLAGYFGPQVIGAEICYDEGKLNPLVANRKLKAHAACAGVRFAVDDIGAIGLHGRTVEARGRRRYSADQIVLAAAWGAGALSTPIGVALPTQWEPLHMNITEPAAYGLRHLVQHADRQITLKQFRSGQIVIGGGWPARYGRGDPGPEVLAKSLLGNVALAGRLVPAIGDLRVLRTWAGLNTTMDGKSAVGRSGKTDRIVFAVPGDAGYTLGPLIGQAAGRIALGQAPPFDIAPYAPDRFS